MAAGVYIATESGVCEVNGEPHVFVKGKTLVEAGHPLLDAVPMYFVSAGEQVHYGTALGHAPLATETTVHTMTDEELREELAARDAAAAAEAETKTKSSKTAAK